MIKGYKKKHSVIGEGSRKNSLVSTIIEILLKQCPSINKVISGPIDATFGNNFRGIRIRPHIREQLRMVYYSNSGKQTFFIFLKGGHDAAVKEMETARVFVEKHLGENEYFIIETK
jgi:hypothetical protein